MLMLCGAAAAGAGDDAPLCVGAPPGAEAGDDAAAPADATAADGAARAAADGGDDAFARLANDDADASVALPDPADPAAFGEYCEIVTAAECMAVLRRQGELMRAQHFLRGLAAQPHATDELRLRHRMVATMLRRFDRRWGLRAGWCCDYETKEERLERIVRRKVRRDVRTACEWDAQLRALEGDAREVRLVELARFEHLTPIERNIYLSAGGCPEKGAPPPPVSRAAKAAAYATLAALTALPAGYLLLFATRRGSAHVRTWCADAAVVVALEACAFEPLAIFLLRVFPTQLIRHKVKTLTNPTRVARFPFRTPLREYPTTYLARKWTGLRRG